MIEEKNAKSTMNVTLKVDGVEHKLNVDPSQTLLQTLREDLRYTSTRGTCGIGVCGTCTVLIDNKTTSSCIMLAAQVQNRTITTSVGLCKENGELSKVQQAFIDRGAYQCSFCIPAMVLAVHEAVTDPVIGKDVESVREALAGNLCRCGTYPEILEVVVDLVNTGSADEAIGRNL